MRFESSVTSITWIPSEAISGMPRVPYDLGIAHYDEPPPDRIVDLEAIDADEMRELVEDAWAFCAPKGVAEEYAARSGRGEHLSA